MADAALALVLPLLYWGMVLSNTLKVKRETGKQPVFSPSQKEEIPLRFGWHLVIAGLIAQPLLLLSPIDLWSLFRPVAALDRMDLAILGGLFAVIGLAGTRWCHLAMGRHWKMWIDPSSQSPIIDQGPYRWMRHPIYSFQVMISVGMWCLIPTPFLIGVIVLHLVCVKIKSSGEERHLVETHGEAYRSYQARTGRFFPKR